MTARPGSPTPTGVVCREARAGWPITLAAPGVPLAGPEAVLWAGRLRVEAGEICH
jgi:hypothetical protein